MILKSVRRGMFSYLENRHDLVSGDWEAEGLKGLKAKRLFGERILIGKKGGGT